MEPMVATAEVAMPEIAPKTAVATTVTMPCFMRLRPMTASTRLIRRFAMPPWLMMPPAMT